MCSSVTHYFDQHFLEISPCWICCSAAKSCPTLCDPMDCSTPGSSVLHCLPELLRFMPIELVMVSNHLILCCRLLFLPSVLPLIMSQLFSTSGQSIEASATVLPMNLQGWFPLELTGLISLQSKGLSRVFSDTAFQSINNSALIFLYGPTLTSIHDYWKNYSFD